VNRNDEITMYQLGRYLSTNEAFWRIFGFQVHGRNPAIQHLQIHLENGQRVYFRPKRAHDVAQIPLPLPSPASSVSAVMIPMRGDCYIKMSRGTMFETRRGKCEPGDRGGLQSEECTLCIQITANASIYASY